MKPSVQIRHSQSRGPIRILASAALCLSLLASSGCSGGTSAEQADSEATLRYGIIGNQNDKLYPYSQTESSSLGMLRYELYDTLMAFDSAGTVHPALATAMAPSDDFTTWDITLRDDVTFSNGATLTAEDIVFSFEKIFDEEHSSSVPNLLTMVDPDQITAVDDHHVRMKLKRPFAPLPELLAYSDVVMFSHESTFDKPIGSGPFTVESFNADRHAVLKRNESYWGDKPGFATLDVTFFKEHDAKLNSLLSGQVDLVDEVSGTDLPQLESSGKQTVKSDSASYPVIEMRTDVEPFDDPRVRRAFQLMVDRDKAVKNVYSGGARVGNDYFAGGDTCQKPKVDQRTQDIAEAKKLLKDAGEEDLDVTLTTDGVAPGMMESAQVLAQGAKEAGVTVKVQKLSTAAFLDKWGDWPMYISFTNPPFIVGVYDHFSAEGIDNTTNFANKRFDELLGDLDHAADESQQCAIITKMHQIIYEDGGELIPAIPQNTTAYSADVKGIKADKLGRSSYMFAGVTVTH